MWLKAPKPVDLWLSSQIDKFPFRGAIRDTYDQSALRFIGVANDSFCKAKF
jgi:hypothetical protein